MDRKHLVATGLVAGLLAGPATADSGKNDSILGSPSRLEALVAQQDGRPAVSVGSTALPTLAAEARRTVETKAKAFRPAAPDRPDVFGSIALSLSSTPLDRHWRRVRNSRAIGPLGGWARSLSALPPEDRADAVNQLVNQRVRFTDDRAQYGLNDVWQSAADTLGKGRGDCEDYAIAKLQLLRAAGIDESDLYLVITRDLVRRADHAVLVVRAGTRLLMLDNSSDRITDATLAQDYRPVISYAAAGGSWTHGYRRTATVELAAGPVPADEQPTSGPTAVAAALR